MALVRTSPGACLICGAAHTSCTAGDPGPITAVMAPARDAAATPASAPLRADVVQTTLAPGSFTSGTYRRKKA